MRPMLIGDSKPDLLWQKSLNTYSKRDHIRQWHWSEEFDGTPVWIGATTHDVGATLSVRYKRFVHHIASNVDEERSKVIRDLRLADRRLRLPRPSAAFPANAAERDWRFDSQRRCGGIRATQRVSPGDR